MEVQPRNYQQRAASHDGWDAASLSPLFYSGHSAADASDRTSAAEQLRRTLRGGGARSEGMLAKAARSQLLLIPVRLDAEAHANTDADADADTDTTAAGASASWALCIIFRDHRIIGCPRQAAPATKPTTPLLASFPLPQRGPVLAPC